MLTKKHCPLFIFFCLVLATMGQAQQPFECNDDAWLVLASQNCHSRLLRVVRDTSEGAVPTYVELSADLGHCVDAIGYNVGDNFIYGLDAETHSLLKIGSDGVVEDLGIPQNLDTTLEYRAAAVKPEGGRMFLVGRQPDGKDLRLYTLQLQPPYFAGQVSVVSDEPVQMGDIAFDPVYGALMAFDEVAGRVVDLTSGGAVSTYPYQSHPQLKSMGGLYFDASGRLLGYGGSKGNENSLFLLNRFSGEVDHKWQWPTGVRSDACSCPYRLRLRKMVRPSRVLPCTEVTVTYVFENTAGISYGNIKLEDEFPPGFEITEVVDQPGFGEQISGLGSNQLQVDMLDVLLGTDSLVIRINVGEFSGTASGQALLFPLPLGLGKEIASDDPSTAPYPDATTLEVVADAVVASDTFFKCAGSPLSLAAAAGADTYLWSTGHNTASIFISQPGTYWVAAQGNCGTYKDTLVVLERPPMQANLGDDLVLSFGTVAQLQVQTNAQGLSYLWQSDSLQLSCYTCPHPQFTAEHGGSVIVSVEDAFGCTATDSLNVVVLPQRYVYVPTVFSPNEDGINDYLMAYGKGNLEFSDFRIYNRWGDLVFSKKSGRLNRAEDGWNGRINGQKAAPGMYTYRLRVHFAEGESKAYQGVFYIVK